MNIQLNYFTTSIQHTGNKSNTEVTKPINSYFSLP